MKPDVVMISRSVDDLEGAVQWYSQLFGRGPDRAPVDSCREWDATADVIVQLLHEPEKSGRTTFAFGVADLAAERARIADAGLTEAESFDVQPFEGLTYVGLDDPNGVRTGLLNANAIGKLPSD